MKAFLGMGLLGSNFVKAMRARGEEVKIWNRTASKAEALAETGAIVCTTPAEAVQNVKYIHIVVKDDAAVDEVLEAAKNGMEPGAIIIDHTTTTKEGAIKRTNYWKDQGFIYQHVPVFMGPANALSSTGFMLLSGDENITAELGEILSPMTGKILHVGTETGKAAAVKLMGNSFLVSFVFSLREALKVGAALDLQPDDLINLFKDWNPATTTEARLKKMTATDHREASWELTMARKDTGLFINAAAQKNIDLTLLPHIAEVMDSFIASGFGEYDWTVVNR